MEDFNEKKYQDNLAKDLKDIQENRYSPDEKEQINIEKTVHLIRNGDIRTSSISSALGIDMKTPEGEKYCQQIMSLPEISKAFEEYFLDHSDSVGSKISKFKSCHDFYPVAYNNIAVNLKSSSEFKESVKNYLEKGNSVTLHDNDEVDDIAFIVNFLDLPEESMYRSLETLILNWYPTDTDPLRIPLYTVPAFYGMEAIKLLPSALITSNEEIKQNGLDRFSKEFGGNKNDLVNMDKAKDIMDSFHLTKKDVLTVIEDYIEKKLKGRWGSPLNGLEKLKKIKALGIERNDFSQNFIDVMKERIDKAKKEDWLELAGGLSEVILSDNK